MRSLKLRWFSDGSNPSTATSPPVRPAIALEDLDDGRLARAIRPEQGEDLALLDGEIDTAHGFHVAVALREVLDRYDRHGAFPRPSESLADCRCCAIFDLIGKPPCFR